MPDINFYKADLQEIEFALFKQFKLAQLFEKPPFDHFSEDDARMILKEAYTFASEVIGPTMQSSDRQGCKLTDDGVKVPEEFHALWKQFHENGWNSLGLPESAGGQGAPRLLDLAVGEMMTGANTAFNMYHGLSDGASAVIRHFGSPEQRELFCPKIDTGAWSGTMVLTEPHAGSDVGLSLTKATPLADGGYSIQGNKIFISGGDQDLTENIVHLVLARIEGAPKGTRGLSLFIVPKVRVNPDGSLGEPNDVICTHIEHKMGINASATAALSFGENGNCVGQVVGGSEAGGDGGGGEGMRKMFLMMNTARLAVGVQGLALASSAYLNALDYARTRLQGAHISQGRPQDKAAVPIIQHADVRRMLLEMKAIVEGCRALAYYTVLLYDQARQAEGDEANALRDYSGLFIPLVKAHITDMGVHVTSMAIQVYGGAGYTGDYPVEQYLRDSRIFPVYEGTNGIQALDLVGRKLGQNSGALVGRFTKEYGQFLKGLQAQENFATEYDLLSKGLGAFNAVLGSFLKLSLGGGMEQVALNATPFLDAMSRLLIAKLLVEGALVAGQEMAGAAEDSQDAHFLNGKISAARYYVRNLLPQAVTTLEIIAAGDTTALEISDRGFSLSF